jgi:hypothetical protein
MTWGMTAVAGATLVGGVLSSNASKSAANTQANAANNAISANERALTQQNTLSQPYRAGGEAAQNRLMQYLGLPQAKTQGNFDAAAYLAANPDIAKDPYYAQNPYQHYVDFGQSEGRAFTSAANDYATSPDFGAATKDFAYAPFDYNANTDPGTQFRIKQGLDAMNATAAARGGLISGNALKAGQDYGQAQGSQEYQNAFGRYLQKYGNAQNTFQLNRNNLLQPLQFLTGQGQAAAANQAANIGNMTASNAALSTGAANATAAGQVGAANAYTNAIGQGVGAYQMNQLINRSAYNSPTSTNRVGGAAPVYDYSTPYQS